MHADFWKPDFVDNNPRIVEPLVIWRLFADSLAWIGLVAL